MRPRSLHDDEGQGLVEMVLLIPMFVILVWGAWFFVELARERLRVHQAARYAAFAAARGALTKYDGGVAMPLIESPTSNHLFVQGQVNIEMMRIFGDITVDLPIPGQLGGLANTLANDLVSQRFRQKPQSFTTSPTPLLLNMQPQPFFGEGIQALVHKFAEGSDTFSTVMDIVELVITNLFRVLMNVYGFNGASLVHAYAQVDVTNKMLPLEILGGDTEGPMRTRNAFVREQIRSIHRFSIGEQVSVIGDSWALGDGRSVWKGQHIVEGGDTAAMQVQVGRLKFLLAALLGGSPTSGVGDKFQNIWTSGDGLTDQFNALTGGSQDGGGSWLDARVTSINYNDDTQGDVDLSAQSEIANGRKKYPTAGEDLKQHLPKRGNHFMGCKDAQRGACDP